MVIARDWGKGERGELFTWHRISVLGTSLVVQWLRIHLPMQGAWVWSLVRVQEDPTLCHGVTKPMHPNSWAHEPTLLKPVHPEPVLRNTRSHCDEKPPHRKKSSPYSLQLEKALTATGTQHSQKWINLKGFRNRVSVLQEEKNYPSSVIQQCACN